jgi:serine/threonine-protein kinase ATR
MHEDPDKNEEDQYKLLSAFANIACAGSHSLQSSPDFRHWTTSTCTLCDVSSTSERHLRPYWNEKSDGEAWKDAIAAMLVITKEPKFQSSPKSRVLMAVAIGKMYNHISDVEYLNLETCELGQWLLGSMSRSLRELKLAAT